MSELLRTIVLSPSGDVAGHLEVSLAGIDDIAMLKAAIPGYPSPIELARLLRSHRPDVVMIDFLRPDLALHVMEALAAETQNVPVIAFGRSMDAALMRDAMRAGARDFLTIPFREEALRTVFLTLRTLVEREPPAFGTTEHIYTFLPSKPGAGATTLAINTAAAIAAQSKRVLLTDLDLSCGMIRFLLKLGGDYSVTDAVSRAETLDDDLWAPLVAKQGNLEILDSGPMSPNSFLRPDELRLLIDYARRRYHALCLDLSGNLEQYSLEAMDESREVFLVCTPDPASLQLGLEKLEYLSSRNLKVRVSVLLNRVDQRLAVTRQQVADYMGIPVRWEFGNHYHEVQKAVQSGGAAGGDTKLGRETSAFAHLLLEGTVPATRKGVLGWFTPQPNFGRVPATVNH